MRRTAASLFLIFLLAGCGGTGENASDPTGDGSTPSAGAEITEGTAPEETRSVGQAAGDLTTGTVAIGASGGSVEVEVEIADDMNEMSRGLMGRTALAEDSGMLFVYPQERELSFWMRDTLIPLSIAFVDSEGRIVDIQDMEPLDDTPPHYVSVEPAKYALEVNRGFFDERGVEVGDRTELPV